MPSYAKPHSEEWFEALAAVNPDQAAATRQIIALAGDENVCGVCGDDPAEDYKLVGKGHEKLAVATMRLCSDCLSIRQQMHQESFAPLDD
jgi:hypothetical protein